MNYWEIGGALESAAKTIKEMPYSIITNATSDVEDQYKAMLKTVTDMQAFSEKCIADLKDLDDAHLDECERICKDVKVRRVKLKEALREVSYEDIRSLNELTSAVEKLRSINPNDLNLIIEILSRKESATCPSNAK